MYRNAPLKFPHKIIWFWNFPIGGISNAIFQYLFAKYIEQVLGCKIILGGIDKSPTILWELLDLPDHREELSTLNTTLLREKIFLGMDRTSTPRHDLEKVKTCLENTSEEIVLVDGYFQFDSNIMKSDIDYLSIFKQYLSPLNSNITFQKQIKKYQNRINEIFDESYFITIHVRRGDYLNFELLNNWGGDIFYVLDLDSVINNLTEYITLNRIVNPVIYIATDDLQFCKSYFDKKDIQYITSEAILGDVDEADINRLLVDIACLTSAKLLVASNSSLSILSSLLNTKGFVFWRQSSDGKMISFDPWSTPILYGLKNGI